MSRQNNFSSQYGPWALVTGASSGIGQQIALQLAQRKLDVILSGRNRAQLEATAQLIRQLGVSAQIIKADLEKPDAVDELIRATADFQIGLFVPAAGFGDAGLFVNADLDHHKSMLAVNINSVMALTHHFAKKMVQQRRGGIIFIASMLAFHGAPYSANYAATKAYILSFGEALAVELKGSGVDVLVSSPGPTDTGFSERAGMHMRKSMTAQAVAVATVDALGRSSTVLPGGLTKFLRGSLMTAPRFLQIRIIGNIMKGFARKP
jgi:uncharacterized protein